MILHMYIAQRQGLTTPWWRNFDVNRNILWLRSFVASFKKKIEVWFYSFFFHDFIHVYSPRAATDVFWSRILYNFHHDLIYVYSPGAGTESPQGTKFWCQQESHITLPICCKFQRNLFEVWKKCLWSRILYNFLHDLIYVYSPGAGTESPQGTKFWCQQEGRITLPICCKFQRNLFEVWFYTFFFMI